MNTPQNKDAAHVIKRGYFYIGSFVRTALGKHIGYDVFYKREPGRVIFIRNYENGENETSFSYRYRHLNDGMWTKEIYEKTTALIQRSMDPSISPNSR